MVALSTIHIVFIVLTKGLKEVLWLKGMIRERGIIQDRVTIYCDG